MLLSKEIKWGIQNENYITVLGDLLNQYKESKDVDHLELINIILSKPSIANRLPLQQINEVKSILAEKGFRELRDPILINEIGVAEFPVVVEDNQLNSIRAIKVSTCENNNEIDNKIVNKKELYGILEFIQNEIQKRIHDEEFPYIKDVTILNWGLSFSIRDHALEGTKLEPADINYTITGNSYHFASVVACISKIFSLPVTNNYIFTGQFDHEGSAVRVNNIVEKSELIFRERPKIEKIFIPSKSNFSIDEQRIFDNDKRFIQVNDIWELIQKVFDKDINDLCALNSTKRHNLGYARIMAEHIGEKELEFKKEFDFQKEKRNCVILHFQRPQNDYKAFQIFPLEKIYFEYGQNPDFIVLEGAVPNHYTGNIMSIDYFKQYSGIIGVRLGSGKEVIVFAAPRGSDLVGYKCNLF